MFKDKIKQLRKSRGLTQKELAALVGVDVSTVGKWEGKKGNVLPSDGVREAIANLFNVPLDYLMDRNTEEPDYDDKTVELINLFSLLNDQGKQLVYDYCEMILSKDIYRKNMSNVSAI